MPTFQETITAAITDLLDHGFDSVERVDRWVAEIKKSAEAQLTSPAKLDKMLREGLTQVYAKLVDKGTISKFHGQQVQRFTIERLKPKLRAELDRRIMASAQLIKLNRQQSIDRTLQRFSGWATSVPAGGTEAGKKAEVKASVRKSLASLPFEERRVLIDQGHKLTASINNIVAVEGGALAVEWHSHWRQAGYDYREDHKERDGHIYLLKDTWATKEGLVRPGPDGWYSDITAVGEEPFCRCYAKYLYSVRDLPSEMLTKKGLDKLEAVRAQMAEMRRMKTVVPA